MATPSIRKILLTGATGLIGGALVPKLLDNGYEVRALVRNTSRAREILPQAVELLAWSGDGSPLRPEVLSELYGVVHLAGEPIAGVRWTAERKRRLRDSRIRATESLVSGVAALPPDERPKVFICGSAVGFYGNRGEERLEESAAVGSGFLAELCRDWEEASQPLDELGVRRVNLRTGVVLDTSRGALAELLRVFRLGLGGPVGAGDQWMSWIHRDDELAAILFLLREGSGPFNLAAPMPVTNRELSLALGRALHRPALLRAPAFALKLALGEMASVLLEGQRAVPAKLEAAGFRFRYPNLEAALEDLLNKPRSSASASA